MYRQGWGWLVWAVLAYALLALGPRVCEAAGLSWVQTPGGNYVAYDPNTGGLFNGNPTWGDVQTIFENGTPASGGGESWIGNMPVMDISNETVGELALTGVDVAGTFASDGMLPLASEIVSNLWGAAQLGGLLTLLGAVGADTGPSGYVPTNYCPSYTGWSALGPVYAVNAQGNEVQIGSECSWTQQTAQEIPSGDYCLGPNNTYCTPPAVTSVPQAVQDLKTGLSDPGSPDYEKLVTGIGNIIANYPQGSPVPAIQPGWVQDTYSGPSSETFPPVTTTTAGQPSTVTPTVTPTYSPTGVSPNVSLRTCTGTGSCTSTTVAPSSQQQQASPFVPPNGLKFPPNPALSPTAVPLSLNPQTVSGTCPPPVELNLAAEDMGSYSISLEPFCTLASYVQPVIVATTAVVAGFIIFR